MDVYAQAGVYTETRGAVHAWRNFKIGLGRSEGLKSLKDSSMAIWFWAGFRVHVSASHNTGIFVPSDLHLRYQEGDGLMIAILSNSVPPLFTSA